MLIKCGLMIRDKFELRRDFVILFLPRHHKFIQKRIYIVFPVDHQRADIKMRSLHY